MLGILLGFGVVSFAVGLLIVPAASAVCDLLNSLNEKIKEFRKKSRNKAVQYWIKKFIYCAAEFGESKSGKEKMEWVITSLQNVIPDQFINDKHVRFLVQSVYDQVKEDIEEQKQLDIEKITIN